MRFDARLTIKLPGDSPEDALRRLKAKLPPGYDLTVESVEPSSEQPPSVSGTININLPATGVKVLNGR